MGTTRQGPSLAADAGFWDQAQDLLFDTARSRLIDVERSSDTDTTPGTTETDSARGGASQRETGSTGAGFTPASMAGLFIGGAILLGGFWLASQ